LVSKQAGQYLQWLTSLLEGRTNQLLSYYDKSDPETADEVEPYSQDWAPRFLRRFVRPFQHERTE
jgi:hypothetical protein